MLIDHGSSIDILFWSAFQGLLQLDPNNIEAFKGSTVVLSGEQLQTKGHITLETIFSSRVSIKTIKVKYLVVDATSPYNIILGMTALNLLGMVLSIIYLSLKYQLPNRRVGTVRGDQTIG